MTTSKDEQETAVGEGLAAGCLALDVAGVTSDVGDLKAAFRTAWRGWSEASLFAAATFGDMAADNPLVRVLAKSGRRRGRVLASWQDAGRWWRPALGEPYGDVDEVADELHAATGVSVEQWRSLAEAFVENLEPDQVSYVD